MTQCCRRDGVWVGELVAHPEWRTADSTASVLFAVRPGIQGVIYGSSDKMVPTRHQPGVPADSPRPCTTDGLTRQPKSRSRGTPKTPTERPSDNSSDRHHNELPIVGYQNRTGSDMITLGGTTAPQELTPTSTAWDLTVLGFL